MCTTDLFHVQKPFCVLRVGKSHGPVRIVYPFAVVPIKQTTLVVLQIRFHTQWIRAQTIWRRSFSATGARAETFQGKSPGYNP
jgi:hypothetical protein